MSYLNADYPILAIISLPEFMNKSMQIGKWHNEIACDTEPLRTCWLFPFHRAARSLSRYLDKCLMI